MTLFAKKINGSLWKSMEQLFWTNDLLIIKMVSLNWRSTFCLSGDNLGNKSRLVFMIEDQKNVESQVSLTAQLTMSNILIKQFETRKTSSKNIWKQKIDSQLKCSQYKSDAIQLKDFMILKLPPFSVTYTVKEKRRRFQN